MKRFSMKAGDPTARNQRGAVVIWLALFLLVMIGFGSLAVDVA